MNRRAQLALLALLTFAACGPGGQLPGHANAGATPLPPGMMAQALNKCAAGTTLPGIDVSVYQGTIPWSTSGSGLKWAYAKATEGVTYTDPQFANNWPGMKGAGLARGAYHFFRPKDDGKAQADAYLAAVGQMGAGDLPPMLDWEVTDGVSAATASARAQAFIDEIHAQTGRATVIYTSPGTWGSKSSTSFGADPLWVADWLYDPTSCPVLPSGWSDWMFWQYSNKGAISGISGNVDLDVFNGDASALATASGGACTGPKSTAVGGGGVVTSGACKTAPPQVGSSGVCGAIGGGEGLVAGGSEGSCDGRFVLALKSSGDLVLYAHGNQIWDTGTAGSGATVLDMQSDGDLVLYDAGGCAVWSTATGGHPGASFAIQSDGNLVVSDSTGALWSSGTGAIALAPTTCGTLASGSGLGPGDSLNSCGGCFTLTMQSDGDLVLGQQGQGMLWQSATGGGAGYQVVMETGGDLVVYSKEGCPVWDSQTGGHAGAYAKVEDDGNLVVYDSSGSPLWSSSSTACTGGCTCNGGTGGGTDGGTGGGTGGTGGGTPDGGTGGSTDGGTGGTTGTGSGGCSCSATGSSSPGVMGLLLVVGLVGLRRRRRA